MSGGLKGTVWVWKLHGVSLEVESLGKGWRFLGCPHGLAGALQFFVIGKVGIGPDTQTFATRCYNLLVWSGEQHAFPRDGPGKAKGEREADFVSGETSLSY